MTLPMEFAVAGLAVGARSRQADPHFDDRLAAVQALLGDDLGWVEHALAEAATRGAAPGTDAARHLLVLGGKRVRPLSLLLSAACFGTVTHAARQLAVVAELLHSATLLHDDVVDEGMERRGAVTSRRLWGNGVSVLAGDLLLVNALERTLEHAPEMMPTLVATLRLLVDGEIIQLRSRADLDLSHDTYDRVLRGKTASLFAWCTSTGARLGGASLEQAADLGTFGERLGIAFQLVDDVLDYSGESTGKTLFADLAEGKLTLPLVLAVERRPELSAALRRIHAGDREPIEEVSRAVVQSGACDEVRRRAIEHTGKAVETLQRMPASPARTLLEDVALELARRAT